MDDELELMEYAAKDPDYDEILENGELIERTREERDSVENEEKERQAREREDEKGLEKAAESLQSNTRKQDLDTSIDQ